MSAWADIRQIKIGASMFNRTTRILAAAVVLCVCVGASGQSRPSHTEKDVAQWIADSASTDGGVRQAAYVRLAGVASDEQRTVASTLLNNDNAAVRQRAIVILKQNADKATAATLAGMLKDNVPAVRKEAAEALGGPQDQAVLDKLLQAADDEDNGVRAAVLLAIARIKPDAGVDLFVAALGHKSLSIPACIGLSSASTVSPKHIPRLNEQFASKDWQTRMAAAHALAATSEPSATSAIWPALASESDLFARKAMVSAIMKLEGKAGAEKLLADDNKAVRWTAAGALAGFADQAWAMELLRNCCSSSDPTTRNAGLNALVTLKREEAFGLLFDALRDPDEGVRRNAARGLGDLNVPPAGMLNQFVKLLTDSDPLIRLHAAVLLDKMADPSAAKQLKDALAKESDPQAKTLMLEAVIRLEGEKSRPSLMPMLTEQDNFSYKLVIMGAMVRFDSYGDKTVIRKLLANESPQVRAQAIYMLARMGDKESAGAIAGLLETDQTSVHQAAARALGKIGDESHLDALATAMNDATNDPGTLVRQSAITAIGNIGGPKAIELLLQAAASKEDKAATGEIYKETIFSGTYKTIAQTNESRIRRAALVMLAESTDPRGRQLVIDALEDQDFFICKAAVEALGRSGDPNAFEPLVNVLRTRVGNDPRDGVDATSDGSYGVKVNAETIRIAVVKALAKSWPQQAIPVLIQRMNGDDDTTAYEAAMALGEIGDKSAGPALLTLMNNKAKRQSRAGARTALLRLGYHEVLQDVLERPEGGSTGWFLEDQQRLAALATKEDLDKLLEMFKEPMGDLQQKHSTGTLLGPCLCSPRIGE